MLKNGIFWNIIKENVWRGKVMCNNKSTGKSKQDRQVREGNYERRAYEISDHKQQHHTDRTTSSQTTGKPPAHK